MKIVKIIHFALIALIALSACDSNPDFEFPKISGKAQKGPLLSGSVVTLSELNENGTQTGRVFTTNILNDDGFFELNDVQVATPNALLTATGFYFNEVYGQLSSSQITLQAYADLTGQSNINVNVLTHITKARIEKLINEGKSVAEAKQQAETEFLHFLGYAQTEQSGFEHLDITANGDANAALLAFSVISQRYSYLYNGISTASAELSDLLTRLSSDFKDEGTITKQILIDTLMHNIYMADLDKVRQNIEKRYADVGQGVNIPDFEKYVTGFQKQHSKHLYNEIYFPENETPDPIYSPDGKITNILHPSITGKIKTGPYALSAIVPFDTKLSIKMTMHTENLIGRGGPEHGWGSEWDQYEKILSYHSKRYNSLMSTSVYLDGPSGRALIEYFINDESTPYISKEISW